MLGGQFRTPGVAQGLSPWCAAIRPPRLRVDHALSRRPRQLLEWVGAGASGKPAGGHRLRPPRHCDPPRGPLPDQPLYARSSNSARLHRPPPPDPPPPEARQHAPHHRRHMPARQGPPQPSCSGSCSAVSGCCWRATSCPAAPGRPVHNIDLSAAPDSGGPRRPQARTAAAPATTRHCRAGSGPAARGANTSCNAKALSPIWEKPDKIDGLLLARSMAPRTRPPLPRRAPPSSTALA